MKVERNISRYIFEENVVINGESKKIIIHLVINYQLCSYTILNEKEQNVFNFSYGVHNKSGCAYYIFELIKTAITFADSKLCMPDYKEVSFFKDLEEKKEFTSDEIKKINLMNIKQ